MKINILIEDATPEELQRLIGTTRLPATAAKHLPVHGATTNFCKGKWSDAEKAAVLSVPEEEAWANYHRLFPSSTRTKNAVWRKRGELLLWPPPLQRRRQSPWLRPMVEKSARVNQFGIPSSLLKKDKKLYQRLWARCKSQGIKYDEALAQEGVMKRGKRPVTPTAPQPAPEKKPRKTPVKKERLPFHQTQTGGSASTADLNSPVVTLGSPARSPQEKIVQNLIVAKNGPLHAGQKVRHNGTKASPFFGQLGEIQKLSADGQVYVKFGESLTWLSPYSVVVVPEAGA